GMARAAALEEREATWPGARRGTVAALVVALRAQGHPSKERIRVLADSLARETAFDPNDPRVITLAGGGPESIQELVAEYVARTTGDIFSPLLVYPAAHALAWAIGDLVGEEDVAHLAPMFRFDQVCLATFALRNLRSDQARALILREVRSGGAPSRIYDALRPYARDPEVAEFVLGGLQNWQSDRERVRIPGYARLARWGDVRPAIPYLEEALQEALEGGGGWTREESLAAFGMELVRWGRKAGMDGVLAAMDRYVRDRSTWERAIDAPWGTTVLQVFEFFNWVAGEQIAETSGEPVMDAAALARLSAWWASVRDAIQFDEATGRWSRP
ncbi:MAG: hypothetical protein O2894_13410, partial [Planctomycetota bacterium]|nr:hypothetical protein [Planctomycetota bacterium]